MFWRKVRAYWGVGLKIMLFAAVGYGLGLVVVTGFEVLSAALVSALTGHGGDTLLMDRNARLLAALIFVPYWLAVGAKGAMAELADLPR